MRYRIAARDVAHAALYLSGPEARYITGVLMPVDGGATRRNAG
jgi:NAD(P)-dependent dehydrogenase (short-subunit alcohol dehydrogenase family)